MWVVNQRGHEDLEMVAKTYADWIPDQSIRAGYQPIYHWDAYIDSPQIHPKAIGLEENNIVNQ